MRLLKALGALLKPDPGLPDHREALASLAGRVAALEAQTKDCLEVVELEAERAARWSDMSAQLRRFLGRLDKHAGMERESAGGHDPKQLAAILRTKFHHNGG